MKNNIDEIITASPAELDKMGTEAQLFKEGLLRSCKQFDRWPNKEKLTQLWERWKRERNLGANTDSNIVVDTLYKKRGT